VQSIKKLPKAFVPLTAISHPQKAKKPKSDSEDESDSDSEPQAKVNIFLEINPIQR